MNDPSYASLHRWAACYPLPHPSEYCDSGAMRQITIGTTLLLGLLSAVGPVSTDIYLPAFAIIDQEFGRSGAGQITLAAWFVGLAFGQLLQGTWSDRFGRRTPLMFGTVIYSAASIGCALAPSLASFSGMRTLAALSGSASMVVPRALIRDVAEGLAAARLLSRLTLVLGVVPIVAPAIGGLLMTVVSWRALFWFAGAYGVLCSLLVWRHLPETLPREQRLRQNPTQIIATYLQIIREPVLLTNMLMGGLNFAALFAYISGSALVYTHHFHISPAQYGLLFGVSAAGFIGASQCGASLSARYGVDRVLHAGALVLLAGFTLAAIDAFAGIGGLAGLVIPIFAGQAATGLMAPLITMNALSRHRAHAGSASALLGTCSFTLGALAAAAVGLSAATTPGPMTALMVAFAALVVVMDRLRPASLPPE